LTALSRRSGPPFFLSLHSYAREVDGALRPWDVGTFWHESDRLSAILIEHLSTQSMLTVGDNLLYCGRDGSFTLDYRTWGTGIAS
jgi:predicted N-formylglutamate amidohydrolase